MLGTDAMCNGGVVDLHDKDSLFKAFEESKLLMQDRVLWQAIRRFQADLDVMLTTDYLPPFVDNTRISQLRAVMLTVRFSPTWCCRSSEYYSWRSSHGACATTWSMTVNLNHSVRLNMQRLYESLRVVDADASHCDCRAVRGQHAFMANCSGSIQYERISRIACDQA
ncbi:unnamed protein product [Symbiodinium natans]|uniref:Uncharacterized protein n=1 Tax=Symbiodinium natans TaxID=878477 RepID=A0A812GVA3_9DINO|nr:unnamed protein product [Symbiodinium natans]